MWEDGSGATGDPSGVTWYSLTTPSSANIESSAVAGASEMTVSED